MTGWSLEEHVQRFNEGVRSGDFEQFVELFADDAVLEFEGVPVGPFDGRDAIAAAYAEQPPDDEIRVLDVREEPGATVAGYAWAAAPEVRAGEMRVDHAGGLVRRLVVSFG